MDQYPAQTQDLPASTSMAEALRPFLREFLRANAYGISANSYQTLLAEFEKPLLEETMQLCQHNQHKAAALLGIHRNTLHKKLCAYGLHRPRTTPDFKPYAIARRRGKHGH